MKYLSGTELAGYIKERQAKEVRRLKQAHGVHPKLAIVHDNNDPSILTYMRLKQRYGQDIGVEVEINTATADTNSIIMQLNEDPGVHGIIVQLPLVDADATSSTLNLVTKAKDVDGLGEHSSFDPAAPTAIMWLLAGYGIELASKKIAIVGHGRLVGAPLDRMMRNSGLSPAVYDETTSDRLDIELPDAQIVISATGQPGLIQPGMISGHAVVIDAGTTSEAGSIKGDVDSSVYERDDLTITPPKGGVGPLTVCVLFDNVLKAARMTIKT